MTQIKIGDTGYIRPPANQLSPYAKAVVVSVDGENLELYTNDGIVNVHRDWFDKAYILDAPQP
ncbi:hypothetical protein [Flavobacterium sp.]|jgi:hypothetical protein|uniref:hypothetical protein n=1 Tax=Flavobacterium sp. TaxID=239 RepID=UPI0037C06127